MYLFFLSCLTLSPGLFESIFACFSKSIAANPVIPKTDGLRIFCSRHPRAKQPAGTRPQAEGTGRLLLCFAVVMESFH